MRSLNPQVLNNEKNFSQIDLNLATKCREYAAAICSCTNHLLLTNAYYDHLQFVGPKPGPFIKKRGG